MTENTLLIERTCWTWAWHCTLIHMVLNLINNKIFSALSKKIIWAYQEHLRPPPTTMVQNPHNVVGPHTNHQHITGETKPAIFSKHCHWRFISSGRLQSITESVVGLEDEGTTILQHIGTIHPTTQCNIPQELHL
jgi:hypothetical protein